MKRSNIMNETTWVKLNSKENFNQLWQGIREVKEALDKLTTAQNEKQEKLTKVTQNLENKLNEI